ncbi:hypothetical protein [Thalassovita sp.]|uniref:hypothetical protein n=1 Tax=Thalassovita sp. TaxID=1979401 RepID=UPI00288189F1|nr:hypothetical protein [Thalassovita sp.]MDF1804713.1 hypothetical protein [Thalassovita sp.]
MSACEQPDPRDEVFIASEALYGVIEMLTETNRQVGTTGLEYVLRCIHERLEPAAKAITGFQPKE